MPPATNIVDATPNGGGEPMEFDELNASMTRVADELRSRDVTVTTTVGPHSPRSIGIRAESDVLLGEVVVWVSGLASLTVVKAGTDEYLAEEDGIRVDRSSIDELLRRFSAFWG